VDDEEFTHEMVDLALRETLTDYRLVKFLNRDEAWQELLREQPDLLITDMLSTNVPGRTLHPPERQFLRTHPPLGHQILVNPLDRQALRQRLLNLFAPRLTQTGRTKTRGRAGLRVGRVILGAATRRTRCAGWVNLNPAGSDICAPWPDPNPTRARSAAWTSPAAAGPLWFVVDSL